MSSKSAKNIKVDGDKVTLDVVLGYPAKSVMEDIKHTGDGQAENASPASATSPST